MKTKIAAVALAIALLGATSASASAAQPRCVGNPNVSAVQCLCGYTVGGEAVEAVGPTTSCSFAKATISAYLAATARSAGWPAIHIRVHSRVTHHNYVMWCHKAHFVGESNPYVKCTGRNGATVWMVTP